jgi:hypothetical protein
MNRIGIPASPASVPRGFRAWLGAYWSRVIAAAAFAVVAGVTGWVSYLHIEELTLALHQPLMVARIMPFGIDGLIVVGSVALLQASDDHPRLGWLCVAPGAVASLFANVESGIRFGALAAAWAGMASAGFFLATFTLERWLKAQAGRGGTDGQTEEEANGGETVRDDTPVCSHFIAGNADEALVQAFLHSRDCLNGALSQRQLSARFGHSRPRVAELVAPWLEGEPETAPEEPSIRFAHVNGSHS